MVELIAQLSLSKKASVWFTGDLINRGPQSLQTLRAIKAMDNVSCVLGNHDLHLLAAAAGVRKPSRRDTIEEILTASDCDELIEWLRWQPLAWYEHPYLMVHAGVHPQWTLEQTLANAACIQDQLRSSDWRDFLKSMYGNSPQYWQDSLVGSERTRVIVNAFTRMRMLDKDKSIRYGLQRQSEGRGGKSSAMV